MQKRIINFLITVPVSFFLLIILLITLFEILILNKSFSILFYTSIVLSVSVILYFFLYYFYYFNTTSLKILKIKYQWYYLYQVKVVFIEELLWRYMPFKLLLMVNQEKYNIILQLVLTLLFTYLHFRKKNVIYVLVLLEFLFYFFITFLIFNKFQYFLILFIPHILRNLIIEYLNGLK
jgi:hypothetical protein